MTEGYSLSAVCRLLGLSRSIVSGMIDAGVVSPTRGRRREYRFSFQDLVVLRTAQGLKAAKIPPARILRSLRRLRAQLPEEVPLAGLRIEAVGDSVVVSEGDAQWRPDDGQYVMQLKVESPGGKLAILDAEPQPAPAARPHDTQWFEHALSLEAARPDEAREAYRRAIADDPTDVAAYINLGRLLHERGDLKQAEAVYRQGLAACRPDETLWFNLAVLLEDMRRPRDAADAYRAALAVAPTMTDAHYNLAQLCETLDLRQEAVRHFSAFRKLTARR